jgi:hypothetical protein
MKEERFQFTERRPDDWAGDANEDAAKFGDQ